MNTNNQTEYPIKIMVYGLTFKRKYIILEKNKFSYNDRDYRYEQITNLYYSCKHQVVNCISSTTIWLGLRTSDGESVFSLESGLKKI